MANKERWPRRLPYTRYLPPHQRATAPVAVLDYGEDYFADIYGNGAEAMAEMRVILDSVTGSTLSAVTGNATGSTVDGGFPRSTATVVAVGTGTLAGTLTIEGSLDNITWVSTGTTVGLTAAATVTATSTGKAFRYFRTSLSGASGSGSCTATMALV